MDDVSCLSYKLPSSLRLGEGWGGEERGVFKMGNSHAYFHIQGSSKILTGYSSYSDRDWEMKIMSTKFGMENGKQ